MRTYLVPLIYLIFSVSYAAEVDVSELFDKGLDIEIDSIGGDDFHKDLGILKENSLVYKGEKTSTINFKNLNYDDWFDLASWKKLNQERELIPDWKRKVRDLSHHEDFGILLKCIGTCKIYRGSKFVRGEYQSKIKERDEVTLEENSYAWIYLMDGSLLSLGPKTSLSFNEINFTKESSFKFMRLNSGVFHLRPFLPFKYVKEAKVETELFMLPVMLKEANREFYAREDFKKADDLQKIDENFLKLPGFDKQFLALETLSQKAKDKYLNQLSFIVTPKGTVKTLNQFVDIFYEYNFNSWARVSNEEENQKLLEEKIKQEGTLLFRGYNNQNKKIMEKETFYKFTDNGRDAESDDDFKELYAYFDAFHKRLFTFELARYLFMDKYSSFLKDKIADDKKMAEDYGYRVWTRDEIDSRLSFLLEFTRRIETTNLSSMKKLSNAKTKEVGMDGTYYLSGLSTNLLKMKKFYNFNQMKIKEFNDLDFYVWLLKNEK